MNEYTFKNDTFKKEYTNLRVVGIQMISKMHKPAGLIVPSIVTKQILGEGHLQQLDQLLGS
jgi:hypothetical protein